MAEKQQLQRTRNQQCLGAKSSKQGRKSTQIQQMRWSSLVQQRASQSEQAMRSLAQESGEPGGWTEGLLWPQQSCHNPWWLFRPLFDMALRISALRERPAGVLESVCQKRRNLPGQSISSTSSQLHGCAQQQVSRCVLQDRSALGSTHKGATWVHYTWFQSILSLRLLFYAASHL